MIYADGVGVSNGNKKIGMCMADIDTVWNSLEIAKFAVSAVTPAIIIWVGYVINRKLDGLKTTSEWKKQWAEKFFISSDQYDTAVSKYIQETLKCIEYQHDNKKEERQNTRMQYRDEINFYRRKLESFSKFAKKNLDAFKSKQETLHKSLEDFGDFLNRLDECLKNGTTGKELLDEYVKHDQTILEAQFEYNKAARQVHCELLGIKE